MEEKKRRGAGVGPGGGIGLFDQVGDGFDGGSREAGLVILGTAGHLEEVGGRVCGGHGFDVGFGSGERCEGGQVGACGGSPEADALGVEIVGL